MQLKTDLERVPALEFAPPSVARAVRNAVVAHLRRMITLGRLRPGERLLQVDLAEKLGVSRMPVRDAINDLIQEGLCVQLPRGGVVVAPITRADMEAIYQLRRTLERFAIMEAARKGSSRQQRTLKDILRSYKTMGRHPDPEGVLKLDRKFHSVIYEMTGNRFVEASMAPVWSQAQRINLTLLQEPSYHEHAWAQHAHLLAHLVERDHEGAAVTMDEHLKDAHDKLVDLGHPLDGGP